MTDDLTGAAPAAAADPVAPETGITGSQVAESPRSAIDRAFAQVDSGDTGAQREGEQQERAASTASGGQERNADGTFKPRAATTVDPQAPQKPDAAQPGKAQQQELADKGASLAAAPQRFSEDAKAAWKDVPESVRGEVARMEREFTKGITAYRQAYEPFHPFVELAGKFNVDPVKTLENYVGIDTLLNRDFDAGIQQIFENKGQNLREWVAKISGQPADQQAGALEQTIRALQSEIAELRQGYQGVSQTVEHQTVRHVGQQLDAYIDTLSVEDKTLFRELDQEIAGYLSDPSSTVADAFAKAKQDAEARYTRMFGLRPQTPAQTTQQQPLANVDPAQTRPGAPSDPAQTRRGTQISGAPGTGSTPASRKPPATARAAVDNAFAQLGLGG